MPEEEKTLQDLEKEKLKVEIELLKQNLKKDDEKKNRWEIIGNLIHKNIALLLAIISVIAAVIGVIIPVNDYFEAKKKEMIPTLNSEIIDLVDKLNDSVEREQEKATVMLSYYGLDAVPVLLYRLEMAEESESERLIQAIKNAYDDNPEGVMTAILKAFSEEFEKNYKKRDLDEIGYYPKFDNYIRLLRKLELKKSEEKMIRAQFKEFEQKIPEAGSDDFKFIFTEDINKLCNTFDIDSIHTGF